MHLVMVSDDLTNCLDLFCVLEKVLLAISGQLTPYAAGYVFSRQIV
jgi:hypothetical protein